jgi:glycosyltransferase involved in cell wall biosynthesis
MEVLMLNYEYPPLGGGAGNATRRILERLAGVPDLRIDLVASSAGGFRRESLQPNATGHFLDIGKGGRLHYQSNFELLRYARLARAHARALLRERRFDLCHAFFGVPCGWIARGLGIPYIVSLRGSDVPFYNPRFKWPDRLLFKRLSGKIWRDAAFVTANSQGLRRLALRSHPRQEIGVIPNGVDCKEFAPAEREARTGLRVLAVSRLIRRKGLNLLIRGFAQLGDPGATLTLVGGGNLEEELRRLAESLGVVDRVHFRGAVPHAEIAPIYRAHDVFVLPSLNEGMSNTALEAMACGLPLLMTPTGGADELLIDGENGFVLEPRSDADIAEKLGRYVARPDLIRAQGAVSRAMALQMSWEETAQRYLDLYRRAIQKSARRVAP